MLDAILHEISFTFLILLVTVVCTAWYITSRIKASREIAALGGRAPRVTLYLPFGTFYPRLYAAVLTYLLGLDLTYRGISSTIRHKNLEFWEYLFSNFGTAASPYTVEAQIVSERFIFTAEPENIKAILATQFEDYGKGKPFHDIWKDFLGDSIFTTDGEQWHDSRALIRPQFIKDRVSDLVIFEKHVNVLLGLMGGKGEEIDVSALFFRYAVFMRALRRQEL